MFEFKRNAAVWYWFPREIKDYFVFSVPRTKTGLVYECVVAVESKTMSKGVHSRMIDGVKHVWKVEDLWRWAEGLPVEERGPNSVIDLERDGWFGGKAPTPRLILDHMRRILEADLDYPVILDQDGSIMDGAHRVCRAILENRKTVKIVRFEKTPQPSYLES